MSVAQLAAPAEPALDDRRWWALQSLDLVDVPPAHAPMPAIPFADLIAVQASFFRSKGTPFFDWLAREIDDLASLARFLHAECPDDFDDRRAVQEGWLREREGVLSYEELTGC